MNDIKRVDSIVKAPPTQYVKPRGFSSMLPNKRPVTKIN